MMNQQGDKLESVIVSRSQATLETGKELARMQYNSEEELGKAIEKGTAEGGDGESSTSMPLNEVGNMIQQLDDKINYIYQSLAQKNDEQAERLAGLIAVTNFESTLAERLVQRKYYVDPKAKSIYEEVRGSILRTMAVIHEKSNTVELLELREKLRVLEMDQMKLQTEKDKVQTEKEQGMERESYLQKRYAELETKHKQAVDGLKAYSKLAKWHEKRVQDVPAIRKENARFLIKQSWEDALDEFENRQAKPVVPTVSF